jgi:hypothetical protein
MFLKHSEACVKEKEAVYLRQSCQDPPRHFLQPLPRHFLGEAIKYWHKIIRKHVGGTYLLEHVLVLDSHLAFMLDSSQVQALGGARAQLV